MRARNRQRYYVRMDRLRATGDYEAFKTKKSKEGMRRYHAMSEEQRNEVKRKNLILQKAWRNKMIQEGTYEAYRQRLNARRRKSEPWAWRGGRRCRRRNMLGEPHPNTVNGGNGWTSIWPVPFLYRGCHWTGQSLSRRRRTRCKPFVAMR